MILKDMVSNKIFLCCVFTVWGLISCKESPHTVTGDISNSIFYEKLSKYFDEPVNILKNNVVITDSNYLKSVSLDFYYFQDKRRESEYWKNGVLAHDRIMNNWYVHFDRVPGDARVTNTVSEYNAPFLPTTGVFRHRHVIDSFDFYHLRNLIISKKIESIFNNLSLRQVDNLNASALDSFFRIFVFYDEPATERIEINTYEEKLDEYINQVGSYDYDTENKTEKSEIDRMKHYNHEMLLSFKSFLISQYQLSSYFLYFYENRPWLITLNEEFENIEGASVFMNSFGAKRKNFSVKVYEVYYPIVFNSTEYPK